MSCDICMKSNFTGKRYKCLICYDFDLCETCHEKFTSAKNSAGVAATSTTAPKMTNTNHNHQETHPMQCILTRNDYELYYGTGGGGSGAAAAAGVLIDYGEQLSFTCPYCGRLGFSESALCEHLSQFHLGGNQAEQQNLSQEVINVYIFKYSRQTKFIFSFSNKGCLSHLCRSTKQQWWRS